MLAEGKARNVSFVLLKTFRAFRAFYFTARYPHAKARHRNNYAGLASHDQLGNHRNPDHHLLVARVASEAVAKSFVRLKHGKITNLELKYHFPPFPTEMFRKSTL